jgi:UDP:flavonoid glycosyltransferase YjiC (YdhE family)
MTQTPAIRLAFFAYALAEVTRSIEVTKAVRARGVEIRFCTHGGTHESHALISFPAKE